MAISRALRVAVRQRAGLVFEYCRMPEALSALRLVVDHIRAQQHDGETVIDNLACCCQFCNYHKGPDVSGINPDNGNVVRLFKPRLDVWQDHFKFNGPLIIPLTVAGRVTIQVLAMNHIDQVDDRRSLIQEGKWRV